MVLRGLFLRYGLDGGNEMAALLQDGERARLRIATGTDVASSKERLDGFFAMTAALTARYSAYAPIPLVAPNTASLGAYAATSLPICSTTPENSWPGIHARSIGSICRTVPEAFTRSI